MNRVSTSSHRPADRVLVDSEDLDAADVGIFSILVVLLDVCLHNPAAERVAVGGTATVGDGHILPADGVGELDVGELDQVVVAGAGVPDDVRGCIAFVLIIVNVKADGPDLDAAEEVDG